jgi:hypothetical protein
MASQVATTNLNDASEINTSPTDKKRGHGHNLKWTPAEYAILVEVLEEEKGNSGQSESGWKKSVWIAVAE